MEDKKTAFIKRAIVLAAAVCMSVGSVAIAQPTEVYVADVGMSRVLRYAPDGSYVECASGFAIIADIELHPDGSLWVADYGAARVFRVAAGCGAVTVELDYFVDFAGATPAGLAIDITGRVFVTDRVLGTVWEITTGGPVAFVTAVDPVAASWGPDGLLYVVTFGGAFVHRFDAAGNPADPGAWLEPGTPTVPYTDIFGIAHGCDKIVFTANDDNQVYTCPQGGDPSDCAPNPAIPSTFSNPWDIEIDCECNLWVSVSGLNLVAVFAGVDPGVEPPVVFADETNGITPGGVTPTGLAVGPDCSDGCIDPIYVVDTAGDRVMRFAEDGSYSVCATGFAEPLDIEHDPTDGSLYVTDYQAGAVYRIAPGCGAVTTVVSWAVDGIGAQPWDLTRHPDGRLFLADRVLSTVWDLSTRTAFLTAADGVIDPVNVSWGADGYLYVVTYGGAFVHRFTEAGQPVDGGQPWLMPVTPNPAFTDISGLTHGCGGIYFTANDDNAVYFCPDNQPPDQCAPVVNVPNSSLNPFDVALDCECNFYVTMSGDSEVLYVPSNGSQATSFASPANGLTSGTFTPVGIVIPTPQI